jgi:hypothetical protein
MPCAISKHAMIPRIVELLEADGETNGQLVAGCLAIDPDVPALQALARVRIALLREQRTRYMQELDSLFGAALHR